MGPGQLEECKLHPFRRVYLMHSSAPWLIPGAISFLHDDHHVAMETRRIHCVGIPCRIHFTICHLNLGCSVYSCASSSLTLSTNYRVHSVHNSFSKLLSVLCFFFDQDQSPLSILEAFGHSGLWFRLARTSVIRLSLRHSPFQRGSTATVSLCNSANLTLPTAFSRCKLLAAFIYRRCVASAPSSIPSGPGSLLSIRGRESPGVEL